MPIYEYICQQCSTDFEFLLRGSEQPACPECGGGDLKKQFSVPAAHTKGASSLPISGPSGPIDCGAPSCCRGRCAND